MVSLQSAENALKSFYLDAIKESIDMKTNPFFAKIESTSENVFGKDVKKVVRVGLNGGVAAGTETGDLPEADGSNYLQLTASLKNLYGTIEISDKAIRASQNNEGAVVNLLNSEVDHLIKSAKYNFGRMLFGNGDGFIDYFSSMDGNSFHLATTTGAVVPGMKVFICDDNGVPYDGVGERTVVSVDRIGQWVEVDGEPLTEPLISGTIYAKHSAEELSGLGKIFNGKELYGYAKADNDYLCPYTQTNVGDIDELKIQTALDMLEETTGAGVDIIICSWGVRRALLKYYKEQGMQVQTMQIEGGFNAISFNGIPVVADRFCPRGTMYLLNSADFKLYQLCDWQWMEGENGQILRQVPGKPVYSATLVKYAELICERPQGQGRLTDINEA